MQGIPLKSVPTPLGAAAATGPGFTALHTCATKNHLKCVALLLRKGADPNTRSTTVSGRMNWAGGAGGGGGLALTTRTLVQGNRTPLHSAAEKGRKDSILKLLEAGADAELRDDELNTAYGEARAARRVATPPHAETRLRALTSAPGAPQISR